MLTAALLALAPPQSTVDVTFDPLAQCVSAGSVVAIDLVLEAASPVDVAAVDAVLAWDPAQLVLLGATPSGVGWLASGFLPDPDGINLDLTDGDALYTALANPFDPPTVGPDLVVATFDFQALVDGPVSLLATLGQFGATEVVGTVPGQNLTGQLGGPAQVGVGSATALEIVRVGTPPNPNVLLPGVTSGPLTGAVWDPVIDHTSFLPGAVIDLLAVTLGPDEFVLPPYGTVLCALPTVGPVFATTPGTPFQIPIPNDCVLLGASVCTQGVSAEALGPVLLTNALDITIGNP